MAGERHRAVRRSRKRPVWQLPHYLFRDFFRDNMPMSRNKSRLDRAVQMLCPGCGQPLTDRVGNERGRRPRYHGPACRQRARRARITNQHGEALKALEAVESAASALRAALLAGADPTRSVEDLRAAADAVALSLAHPTQTPPAERVTESVTVDNADAESTQTPVRDRPVPKPKRRKPFDVDSVRLERSTDPARPGWRILAGPVDDPTVIGLLEPALTRNGNRGGGWRATTYPLLLTVPGGPWKRRQDALIRLVDYCLR